MKYIQVYISVQLHFDHMRRVYCVCGGVASFAHPSRSVCLCVNCTCFPLCSLPLRSRVSEFVCVCEWGKENTRFAIQNESNQVYFRHELSRTMSRRARCVHTLTEANIHYALDKNNVSVRTKRKRTRETGSTQVERFWIDLDFSLLLQAFTCQVACHKKWMKVRTVQDYVALTLSLISDEKARIQAFPSGESWPTRKKKK